MPAELGKSLIFPGILLLLVGLIFLFADRISFLDRLPGDIVIRGDRTTVYFPIVTCLLISLLLSLLCLLFRK